MERFVLDASVGVKWLFKAEEGADKAALFIKRLEENKIKIHVPEFFYVELANACWVKVKKKLAGVSNVIEGLDEIMNFTLSPYPDKELADVALENSLRLNISAYDGLYLALAEIWGAPLVTADERLVKICQGRFDFIESLQEVTL